MRGDFLDCSLQPVSFIILDIGCTSTSWYMITKQTMIEIYMHTKFRRLGTLGRLQEDPKDTRK